MTLEDWDRLGRGVHTLVNLMPSGKYLMEDFYYAGGLPAVLRELGENELLHKDALTVNGKTHWENVKDAPCWNRDVIFPFKKPFKKNTGIAVLRGNLCPDGAIIKPSAATPEADASTAAAPWCSRTSRTSTQRIDDPKLDIDERCVMVLKNCGPKGYPGHGRGRQHAAAAQAPEEGHHRHGAHLGRAHERHRVRHGVLHISPEAAAGGMLALVQNGDVIELDVAKGAAWSCWCPRKSSQKRRRNGKRRKPRARARLLEALLSTTCTRRTRARISISSSARAVRSCRATITR